MRAISLKLPDELDERITRLAARRKVSRAALLREAIEAYVGEPAASIMALAGDLTGSLEGPAGLSTSPRRLAEYGR